MRDEAIYYMQSAFNNRPIAAVVGVYQTAAAAIALANLVTFPEEVSADALHAAAGLLADLVQTAADASDYGLSQDAVWSVSEAVRHLIPANSYALDALTAADYTPPPPYPPEPPSPITPPPPPPQSRRHPCSPPARGSGEVGSGSVEVGSGPSYYIGSPYPPSPPTATHGRGCLDRRAACNPPLRCRPLTAGAHALPFAATKGWVHDVPRTESLPPFSPAASIVTTRLVDPGCSPDTRVTYSAQASPPTNNSFYAKIEMAMSAVCDANGRGTTGRGEGGVLAAAGQALSVSRFAGVPVEDLPTRREWHERY